MILERAKLLHDLRTSSQIKGLPPNVSCLKDTLPNSSDPLAASSSALALASARRTGNAWNGCSSAVLEISLDRTRQNDGVWMLLRNDGDAGSDVVVVIG